MTFTQDLELPKWSHADRPCADRRNVIRRSARSKCVISGANEAQHSDDEGHFSAHRARKSLFWKILRVRYLESRFCEQKRRSELANHNEFKNLAKLVQKLKTSTYQSATSPAAKTSPFIISLPLKE